MDRRKTRKEQEENPEKQARVKLAGCSGCLGKNEREKKTERNPANGRARHLRNPFDAIDTQTSRVVVLLSFFLFLLPGAKDGAFELR